MKPLKPEFLKRLRSRDERGAAVVEFAIAVPIFLALIALIFDAGLGFSASRSSASAARSAARVGALAGDQPNADFQILQAIKAKFGDGQNVRQITVYVSDPGANGAVPLECRLSGVGSNKCNVYSGAVLNGLNVNDFGVSPTDGSCISGSFHESWCPTSRRANKDQYLGVAVWTTHDTTIELFDDQFDIEDRSVFPFYFPPLPSTTPTN